MSEQDYEAGSRMAWLHIFQEALRHLGRDTPEWTEKRWVGEREYTVSVLRRICAEHGDNDWSDDLNLGDVIEKHLGRYLETEDEI